MKGRHKAALSVYSYSDLAGGNTNHYVDLHIRLYHEPDIDWWIEERMEGYYEFNSIDIAGFVIGLRRLGSQRVELITTSGKGIDREGKRKTHSWTIVDEPALMEWVIELADALPKSAPAAPR